MTANKRNKIGKLDKSAVSCSVINQSIMSKSVYSLTALSNQKIKTFMIIFEKTSNSKNIFLAKSNMREKWIIRSTVFENVDTIRFFTNSSANANRATCYH